jgi:uroporphyrinogen-III synthase
VIVMPVLQIEFIPDPELGGGSFDALVLTSVNAVQALGQHKRLSDLQTLPAYTVGRRTAAAAREIGLEPISADGNQHDLVALIGARSKAGASLLYFAGQDRSGDLEAALAPNGLKLRTIVAYRAVPVRNFAAAVVQSFAAGQIDVVLHYSRRSAAAFLQCAEASGVLEAGVAALHFCLSRPVAEPLRHAGAARVMIAPRPEEATLLDLVAEG